MLEPIHIIAAGLLIAIAGVAWQWQRDNASSTKATTYIPSVAMSDVKMTISEVVFPKPQPNEFIIMLHLANSGPASTVKDFRLAVYRNGELLEQFPPREAYTGEGLGTRLEIWRGIYLSREPLETGAELDASITYQTIEDATRQIRQPGTELRLAAVDIKGKPVKAEYKPQ